jgi:hypothetical protein
VRETWLIQRLSKPPRDEFHQKIERVFSFGGGGSGLSDEAWKILHTLFSFEYMGAAEYEFGAPNRALYELTRHGDVVSCKFQIRGTQIKENWWRSHRRQLDRYKVLDEARKKGVKAPRAKKPKKAEIPDAEIGVVCRAPDREEVEARIRLLAKGQLKVRDSPCFTNALDPVEDHDRRHCGWLEVSNGFLFFTDLEMWKKASESFGSTPADPPIEAAAG